MNSEQSYEEARHLIPGGVNSPVRAFDPYPFFASEGEGSKIRDEDGNEYIDYCLGYGPLILGHKNPNVVNAVQKQVERGALFGTPNETEIRLAEKIIKHVPCAEKVRFVNSGTEATSSAIRLARACTGQDNILMFDGGYHGAHDHFLFDSKGPKSSGIPKSIGKNTLLAPFNDIESVKTAAEGGELAAIIVEPVMGNAGCIPPKQDFLEGLRDICDDSATLLFFDEVITGFRLALGGAQEYYGVKPDLVTLGKIIGGGFPIGAFAGNTNIMKNVAPEGEVFQAGTFNGHPISMTAGLATIREIEEKGVIKRTSENARRIAESLQKESGCTVNRVSSMFQIFFTENDVNSADGLRATDKDDYKLFHRELMKKGIFAPPARSECWFVSSAHSKEDLGVTKEALEETFAELKK